MSASSSNVLKLQPTTAKPSNILKLNPKTWEDKIKDYATARQTQKDSEAAARAAQGVRTPLRDEILFAMGDSPAAICGNIVLTVKRSAGAAAALTLTDGSKIPWASVTSLLVGNRTIPVSDIKTLFGGRDGSVDIDITGF